MLGGANHQIAVVAGGFIQTLDAFRRKLNARQQFPQRFTATLALYRENHRAGKGLNKLTQALQRRLVLRLNGKLRQRLEAEVSIGRFFRQALGFELHARPFFQLAV